MNYTPEQQAIIGHQGNAVVIARPGSGKTATLAQIIRNRLSDIPEHRGVIAISFTNKASAELRNRALTGVGDKKSSFFGTIDRFFIVEIVIAFGRRTWGAPQGDLVVSKNAELPIDLRLDLEYSEVDSFDFEPLLPSLGDLYRAGYIVLEAVGFMACHLFENSAACRRYIRARYTDLIVDEYQDCGPWQHAFFMLAADAGLRTIAVGDLDQSIFLFAGKKAKYLKELQDEPGFRTFFLTLNHRCHTSIAEYAARFISEDHPIPGDLEPRVFEKSVDGSEIEIAEWLNEAIPAAATMFNVRARNQIGILVKSHRSAQLVGNTLVLPHKYSVGTVLDEDSSPAASIYRDTLQWLFDPKKTRRGFVDDHLPPETRGPVVRRVVELLTELQTAAPEGQLAGHVDDFRELALIINGQPSSDRATERLLLVLASEEALQSFIAPHTDQVQLMTIHKAKSLEFDVVFHLDLYEYIMPMYRADAKQEEQDKNLHYVALTRAKQACFLCTSTSRHSNYGRRDATPSPFLFRNGVEHFRMEAPF
jgi:superfamily I DNA/RNA helicase